ncbi:MAG: hypothetical protein RLZZ292_69 [Bacteroidota bacterium]|jgi:hypothetical protein
MKKLLFLFPFLIFNFSALAQFNTFPKNTVDSIVYHTYLSARDGNWTAFEKRVLLYHEKDKRKVIPAVTQIIYNMALSVQASCYEKDVPKAEGFLSKCDELFRKYETKKTGYWTTKDYVLWRGMKTFWSSPLETWRPLVKNKGVSVITRTFGLPEFPFPPPNASGQTVLPNSFFKNCKKLGDIDQKLNTVLLQQGYERSYFKVPGGFAIVSRLEQINDDASSKQEPNRWSDQVPPVASFSEFVGALFFPRVGFFRIVVFMVTDVPFNQKQEAVSKNEATAWLADGKNVLPEGAAILPLNPNFNCTALIYEYQFSENQKSSLSKRFSVQTHLEKARLWGGLK